MVLPEPTGPPMPMRTIRLFGEGSGDEEAFISDFVLHRGDLHEGIEPAEFVAGDGERSGNVGLHVDKRMGEDALRGVLADAQ